MKRLIQLVVMGGVLTVSLSAQAPDARPQRPQLTPEQQAEAAKRREAEMNAPRPIAALDSVWTEELTWMEVRDAIKAGKTTGLILTGGVESNGPHLATGKHNFVLKVMGEAIARKLGNALVAPILTLEPGRPDGERVAPGSVVLSAATYRAVLTDMAMSLKGMGFTNVILMGDSGGNQGAMKEVAAALDEKYKASGTRFYFIPEYYDYASVQKLLQEQRHSRADRNRREPGLGSHPRRVRHRRADGALRSEDDPHRRAHQSQSRDHQRRSLLPMSKTLEMGKKIVELRAKLTVDAINKATHP